MKVINVKSIGKKPVYDLSVNSDDYDEQYYVLENGVISHNTGSYYSADTIWILGRQQDKDGTEIKGYNFIINVEKSRYVKEKSKIPITVSFDGGINRWSGLIDIAIEGNFITKPSPGWYAKVNQDTGEVGDKVRIADTQRKEFWQDILSSDKFQNYVQQRYQIAYGDIMGETSVLEETESEV